MIQIDQKLALQVDGLGKRYRQFQAVKDLSFSVQKGSIFGLLGPNGAGKTTSIRMISGLLQADQGAIQFFGQSLNKQTLGMLGLCPQELAIWDNLTVMEQMLYVASIYNIDKETAKKRANQLLDDLQMSEHQKKMGHALSGGMKRRLNIMLALMHDPEILILDEPQAGLDPQSRLLVRSFIESLRGKKTVLITTHDMEEAEKLLDQVAIIDGGTILAQGTSQALKAKYMRSSILRMTWTKVLGQPEKVLGQHGRVELPSIAFEDLEMKWVGDRLDLVALESAGAMVLYQELQQLIGALNLPIFDLELRQPTLEDLFIHLTGRSLRE